MAIWDTPEQWDSEFLRSQKFNKEVRDKQVFLFKRPRTQVTLSNAGSLSITTSLSFIDETGFVAEIETTGRPLLVTVCGVALRGAAVAANQNLVFDCVVNNRYASTRGGYTAATQGAYWTAPYTENEQHPFVATMFIDWLSVAGVYLIKPMWFASTAMSINTATYPIDLLVEEL